MPQLLASEPLEAARAAAEDWAPTPAISTRLCCTLAAALHDLAATSMLQQAQHLQDNSGHAAASEAWQQMVQVRAWVVSTQP